MVARDMGSRGVCGWWDSGVWSKLFGFVLVRLAEICRHRCKDVFTLYFINIVVSMGLQR
jgi:hypothetical protein